MLRIGWTKFDIFENLTSTSCTRHAIFPHVPQHIRIDAVKRSATCWHSALWLPRLVFVLPNARLAPSTFPDTFAIGVVVVDAFRSLNSCSIWSPGVACARTGVVWHCHGMAHEQIQASRFFNDFGTRGASIRARSFPPGCATGVEGHWRRRSLATLVAHRQLVMSHIIIMPCM